MFWNRKLILTKFWPLVVLEISIWQLPMHPMIKIFVQSWNKWSGISLLLLSISFPFWLSTMFNQKYQTPVTYLISCSCLTGVNYLRWHLSNMTVVQMISVILLRSQICPEQRGQRNNLLWSYVIDTEAPVTVSYAKYYVWINHEFQHNLQVIHSWYIVIR